MSKISFSLRRIAKNWADKPDSAAIFTDAADEIESLAERIAELEADLAKSLDWGNRIEADNKRLAKYAKGWHDGHKVGMERAAEILERGIMKEGNYLWIANVNEYLRYASKAIRKEIDK